MAGLETSMPFAYAASELSKGKLLGSLCDFGKRVGDLARAALIWPVTVCRNAHFATARARGVRADGLTLGSSSWSGRRMLEAVLACA